MFDPIAARIELALAAMDAEPPANTPELDTLFAKLQLVDSGRERDDTEERIWSVWCSHGNAEAEQAMQSAIDAFTFGDLGGAAATLDTMVERWPDWAEAWNKRAALRFVQDRDAESLDDIARTLEREPRHFGALSGFGKICLRSGYVTSALLVFERVLHIDPHLEEVREAVSMLRQEARHTVH